MAGASGSAFRLVESLFLVILRRGGLLLRGIIN